MRAAKVPAKTGDSDVDPNAVSLSEAIDDSSFGVGDAKVQVHANRHLDPTKAEIGRSKDVDACRWIVDLRTVAPCRNGEIHRDRGFVAQIPICKSRTSADHALRSASTHDHEVDLVDPDCLS